MAGNFRCPNCRKMILPEKGEAGGQITCPFCHKTVTAILHDTPTGSFKGADEESLPPRLGDYEIMEAIGEGGMGVVYKARNLRLDRTVALKILPTRFTRAGSQHLERFLREARAAAQLDHPNVVAIHAVGEAEGRHFIEMQYVEGRTLAQILTEQEQLSVEEAVRIVTDVARALAAAHSKGIVHRDIKPDNVMISADGTVKVMDFGLARSEAASAITGQGQVIGTPHYMSPEQCEGKPADRRSDIYSLGATLYKMLSGRPPFTGDTPLIVMRQHSDKKPLPLKEAACDLPDAICDIVEKMLRKDPDQRFQNCEEFLSAIEQWGGEARARRRGRARARRAAAAVGFVGILLLGALVYGFWGKGKGGKSPAPPPVAMSNFPSTAARAFGANLIKQRRKSATGRTLSVSRGGTQDFHRISEAIADAKTGDMIEILDSETYFEEVILNKPDIYLRAAAQEFPTIDAEKKRAHCILVEESGRGAVIEGIRCIRSTSDGLLVSAGADDAIIFSNACSENRWGIRIKGHRALVIANVSSSNESYGIQLWESQGSKIADSLAVSNSSGIDVNLCRDCVIAGNIIHANRKSGMQCRESEAILVNGNVFHKCEGDALDLDDSRGVDIFNNIVAFCSGAGISFDQKCEGIKAHHNNIFECNSYGRSERKWFKDLGAWMKDAGQGQGSISLDPAFSNPPSDLSLRENSPCRGKGADGLDIGIVWSKSGLERLPSH